MNHDQRIQENSIIRTHQERYNDALEPWGQSADGPTLNQNVSDYRRETVRKMKQYLPDGHELRIPVRKEKMPDDIFDVIEPQILKAVKAEAYNASSVPPGEMRRVVDVDPNGLRVIRYIGQTSFIHDHTQPGRRVISFRNPLRDHTGATTYIECPARAPR
jgi:hypothetical protein